MKTHSRVFIFSFLLALVSPAQSDVRSMLINAAQVGGDVAATAKALREIYGEEVMEVLGVRGGPQRAHSAATCNDMLATGTPVSREPLTVLCREAFVIGYNNGRKTPTWVIEKLDAQNLSGPAHREDGFSADMELPVNARAEDKDYLGKAQGSICRDNPGNVNYCMDRGHMAPADDLKFSPNAMRESFLLSNVAPQNAQLNRGLWLHLEKKVRSWARSRGSVFVTTGTIYERDMGYIGKRVQVPSHLYKFVVDMRSGESMAFVMPNEPVPECVRDQFGNGGCSDHEYVKLLPRYKTTVRDIERRTGVNFNPSLKKDSADQVEATNSPLWR